MRRQGSSNLTGPVRLGPAAEARRLSGRMVLDTLRDNGVLILLTLTSAVAFMDRQLLVIVQESVKRDLHLSDSQIGLLTGFSFALFYSLFGIPVGQACDRWSRRNVLALSMLLWSVMTALTSLAPSFAFMLLTRMFVAIGEASVTPASTSIITERYSLSRRATAMSVFAGGQSLGLLMGFFVGSRLEQAVGWRTSFLFAGIPGLVLVLILMVAVREPARTISRAPVKLMAGLRIVAGFPTLRRLAVAVVLGAFVTSATMSWGASYLIRSHHMSVRDVGAILGLAFGIGGALGSLAIGMLTDRLVSRDLRWYLWSPALVTAVMAPFIFAALMASSGPAAALFLAAPSALGLAYVGIVYSVINMVAPGPFRATTTALFVLVQSIIGTGVGGWLVGFVSDQFAPSTGAASIKWSLVCLVPAAAVVAAIQYARAAATLREDLARADAGRFTDPPGVGDVTSPHQVSKPRKGQR